MLQHVTPIALHSHAAGMRAHGSEHCAKDAGGLSALNIRGCESQHSTQRHTARSCHIRVARVRQQSSYDGVQSAAAARKRARLRRRAPE